ncbi:MAG: hypothetical protein IJB10_01205 [Clostridia bacterium]|nr:hypothetical protein [Clostridia bacterium]
MERIELNCTKCGGKLNKIEKQKDTYICLHCGNKEIIKEETTSNNYYVSQNITKNIYGTEKLSEEDYYKLITNAEKFIKIKDYKKAISLAEQAKKIDEGNYLAWWISTKAKLLYDIEKKETDKRTIYFSIKSIEDDYKKAYSFAEDNVKNEIEEEYKDLYKRFSVLFENATTYVEANFEEKDINNKIKAMTISGYIVLAIAVFCGIFMLAKQIDDLLAVMVIFFFVGIILLFSTRTTKDSKKIIEFIKKNEKVSFDELLSFCEKSLKSFNRVSMIEKKVLIEALNKRISDMIREGFLTGYKIENYFIIKVEK